VRRPTVIGETTYKFYPRSRGGYRYV
jgi:hypothetical protein